MTTASRLLTVEEFEEFPEPDAGKLDLDDGVVVVTSPVGKFHGSEIVESDSGRTFFESTPDLAVEIASTSDRRGRITMKVSQYLAAGSKRAWVIWPEHKLVKIHRTGTPLVQKRPGDSLSSDDAGFAVEGFELAVAEIF